MKSVLAAILIVVLPGVALAGSAVPLLAKAQCDQDLKVQVQYCRQIKDVRDQYEFQSAKVVAENEQLKAQIQSMGKNDLVMKKELASLRKKLANQSK